MCAYASLSYKYFGGGVGFICFDRSGLIEFQNLFGGMGMGMGVGVYFWVLSFIFFDRRTLESFKLNSHLLAGMFGWVFGIPLQPCSGLTYTWTGLFVARSSTISKFTFYNPNQWGHAHTHIHTPRLNQIQCHIFILRIFFSFFFFARIPYIFIQQHKNHFVY